MNQSDIALLRIASQHIAGTKFTSPKEIVSWMGAMQAQDYPMSKWAIGVRLPGSTDQEIEVAITNAEIIRTHLLRPTWHYVSAEDVYWLLDLTAAQIKAAQSWRDGQLELTESVYTKSNTVIEKALSAGRHLVREELILELNRAGIATDQNRASHLFARAELEKIICSGISHNGKTTYALLSERVRKTGTLTKDEALAELARCYFISRCPATLPDFAWWSGLPARDANHAGELVKSDFTLETINGRTYWLIEDLTTSHQSFPSTFLLPTYDEFTLSYTDRSASIPVDLEQHMKEISDRGVFRPIIVVNGQVVGIWKRTIQKDTIRMNIQPFGQLDSSTMDLIDEAVIQYANFLSIKIFIKR